ncbi:MAG: manganese transporter [Candidatus Dadabacteria bacterium]|nr:MAG: manganese transporter [Candidatus Dadabacteria bacterium]
MSWRIRLAVCALPLLPLLAACERQTAPPAEAWPVRIVATTNILADTVRHLAPDTFNVAALMGPGIDPHLYRASAGDVRRLQQADAIVYNGLHLEGKMTDVLDGLREQQRRVMAAAEALPPDRVHTSHGAHDPHVWMDVQRWRQVSSALADQLADWFPGYATEIAAKRARWEQQLTALDADVRNELAAVPPRRRVLITAHDAFEYFGESYNFEVMGLMGISTLAEAGTNDIRRLADVIVERGIPAIFVESTISDRYLRALQENVAARGQQVRIGGTLYADALGEPDGPAGTYFGMIRTNARTIAQALAAR